MTQLMERASNSLEIIHPFVDSIAARNDVQIMGGVGTAALANANVEINSAAKEVYAPEGFYLPARREDGTKRDIDVLVLSSNKEHVAEVETTLETAIGNSLERSVFGVRPHEILADQVAHPLGFRALKTFLADRYEALPDDQGVYVKSLFPFSVPITSEALETWSLFIGNEDRRIPIPHPGVTITNYTSRSISGLRPRDADKIAHVAENIFEKAPEVKDWIIDGPGASQLELSRLIASIRRPNQRDISLVDGLHIDTYSYGELAESDYFMNPEQSARNRRRIVTEAAIKAMALHRFESSPGVVKFWRRFMEKRSDSVVKNL